MHIEKLFLSGVAAVSLAASGYGKEKTTDYLFATFLGDGGPAGQQVCMSVSHDGNHWFDLNDRRPILDVSEATAGDRGVRDPFMIRHPETGKVYLIATDLCIGDGPGTHDWGTATSRTLSSECIRVWETDDLVHWSEPWLAHVGPERAAFTWAPEAIWDKESRQFMVYWAAGGMPSDVSDRDEARTYYCMTKDFRTFTEAKYYCSNLANPDKGHIDTSILHVKDDMYVRTSSDGTIPIDVSETGLFGKWRRVTTMEDLGFMYGHHEGSIPVEGPEIFRYNDDDCVKDANGNPIPTFGVIMDNFGGIGYIPVATTNFLSTVKRGQPGCAYFQPDFDFNSPKRHGCVLPITAKEYDAIVSKWGLCAPARKEKPVKDPVLAYDFSSSENFVMEGSATLAMDIDTDSTVLRLDGSQGTYAAIPRGYMDGRDEFTLVMDVKNETVGGNFMTFALGKGQNKYMALELRDKWVSFGITRGGHTRLEAVEATLKKGTRGRWVRVMMVVKPDSLALYLNYDPTNGKEYEFIGSRKVHTTVSQLGRYLRPLFGKSFFRKDKTFKGSIDNVKVYNRAIKVAGAQAAKPAAGEMRLVASYDMKHSGNTLKDAGAFGRDAKLVGFNDGDFARENGGDVLNFTGDKSKWVELPADIVNGEKFAVEVRAKTPKIEGNWLWCLGSKDVENYFFLSPAFGHAEHGIRCGAKMDGEEIRLPVPLGVKLGEWFTIRFEFDHGAMKVLVNGEERSRIKTRFSAEELLIRASANGIGGYIGKSLWGGDPAFTGTIGKIDFYCADEE